LNKLLGQGGVVGIKTGTTDASGENLVTLVERDGHRVLIVLLNSRDRFGETKHIIDWIFANYSWHISE
jgi:D-alanyl-D-alanine carboxypeptidase